MDVRGDRCRDAWVHGCLGGRVSGAGVWTDGGVSMDRAMRGRVAARVDGWMTLY